MWKVDEDKMSTLHPFGFISGCVPLPGRGAIRIIRKVLHHVNSLICFANDLPVRRRIAIFYMASSRCFSFGESCVIYIYNRRSVIPA